MIERKEWQEFSNNGLLWIVNKGLLCIGWTIVLVRDEDDNVVDVFPAKVKARYFSKETDEKGRKLFNKFRKDNEEEITHGERDFDGLREYYYKEDLEK